MNFIHILVLIAIVLALTCPFWVLVVFVLLCVITSPFWITAFIMHEVGKQIYKDKDKE